MNKQKITSLSLAATAVLLLAVALWGWFFWTPLGTLVRGPGFEGVILNPIKILHDPDRLKNTWTPGRDQIVDTESRLKNWITNNSSRVTETINSDLGRYRRRYAGILKDGKRMIAVEMYHPKFISRHTWLRHPFWSAGGGDWAWYITYNLENQTFTNFFTNAPM